MGNELADLAATVGSTGKFSSRSLMQHLEAEVDLRRAKVAISLEAELLWAAALSRSEQRWG